MHRTVERLTSRVFIWLFVFLWVVNPSWSAQQAGDLDPTFDLGPFVVCSVYAFAVQPDGRVLTGASSLTPTNRITRDENFTASVTGGTGVRAVVLQPDGKVLIGGDFTGVNGASRGCVARLNSDGSLDQSFADPAAGKAEAPIVLSLALQPDGRVLIAGSFGAVGGIPRNNLARLNADGTLDGSFQADGTGADGEVHAIVLQPDGKILIGGAFRNVAGVTRPGIARLNGDGTLDRAFGSAGTNGAVDAVALQPDAKIVVGGDFTLVNGVNRNRIARLDANGNLDPSFQSLTGADNRVRALVLQADGKIIIGGAFTTFDEVRRDRVARLNMDGTLDTSYAQGDGCDNEVRALALAVDLPGWTLVGGDFDQADDLPTFRRAALHTGGRFVYYPGSDIYGEYCGGAFALQPDGKILRTCSTNTGARIIRTNPDGSFDPTFRAEVTGSIGILLVNALAVQPDLHSAHRAAISAEFIS